MPLWLLFAFIFPVLTASFICLLVIFDSCIQTVLGVLLLFGVVLHGDKQLPQVWVGSPFCGVVLINRDTKIYNNCCECWSHAFCCSKWFLTSLRSKYSQGMNAMNWLLSLRMIRRIIKACAFSSTHLYAFCERKLFCNAYCLFKPIYSRQYQRKNTAYHIFLL